MYSKVCRTRITRLEASRLGFRAVAVAIDEGSVAAYTSQTSSTLGPLIAILLQRGVFFHKRASVSKFYFGCFQNATGSSSAPSKAPELRIELAATVFNARGPEIP